MLHLEKSISSFCSSFVGRWTIRAGSLLACSASCRCFHVILGWGDFSTLASESQDSRLNVPITALSATMAFSYVVRCVLLRRALEPRRDDQGGAPSVMLHTSRARGPTRRIGGCALANLLVRLGATWNGQPQQPGYFMFLAGCWPVPQSDARNPSSVFYPTHLRAPAFKVCPRARPHAA